MVDRATGALALRGGRVNVLRRFLDRFRRPSGVPAAAAEDLSAELAPLFVLLDQLEAEAAGLRLAAARSMQGEREAVSEEVESMLADARERAEAERADALKAARRAADAEARAIVAAGAAEAERIGAVGRERVPLLVAEVVGRLRAFPGDPS